MCAEDDERLVALRARIDRIDDEILGLLNERARLVVSIGTRKRELGVPVRAPSREAAVLARLRRVNPGPLQEAAVQAIFRTIMESSYPLETHPSPSPGKGRTGG